MSGNGTFDANIAGDIDYGDSFLKLNSSARLTVVDYFTPDNESILDDDDLDLGSSVGLLLPKLAGALSHSCHRRH